MLADAIGEFLDAVTEREFDEPLLALLRAQGFTDIHFLHGSYEFGKDAIAKRVVDGQLRQFVIQSKAGDLNQSGWQSIVGQIDLLKNNTVAHPNFDATLPRRAVLVMTGRLVGGGLTVAQNYEERSVGKGEPPLEIWDRERLQEFLIGAPDALLTGSVTGPLLGVLAAINDQEITDGDVERFSASWMRAGEVPTQASAFEAALVAGRLAHTSRKDLAALTGLGLVRSVWASVHATEPPPLAALEMAEYGRQLFLVYAKELWDEAHGIEADGLNGLNAAGGHFSTYRVLALRLVELFGLLALAEAEFAKPVAEWLKQFFKTNPAASQPISDKWGVSLIPAAVTLNAIDPTATADLLRRVTRWTCDYYEGHGLGLAAADAEPQQEVDYLFGGAFEHITLPKRKLSYIATIVLDLAAALGHSASYDDARNDFLAVDAGPGVPTPRDDVDQYKVAGADVPLNTAPNYAEEWQHGDDWHMAPHHRSAITDCYLGRIGRPWDQLAVSAVTRDRHWVAAIRAQSADVAEVAAQALPSTEPG